MSRVPPHILAAAARAELAPLPPAPILDYAGKASRTRFRLPARSIIRWDRSGDELRVVERLDGRANAFAALAFAVFTLVMLVSSAVSMLPKWQRNGPSILFLAVTGLAELAAMGAVIDSSWRVTRLIVTPRDLALRFWSPLRGTKAYRWPAEKLHSLGVTMTTMQLGGPPFPELEFNLWGEPLVRLFIGHPTAELEDLIREIRAIQPPAPLPTLRGESPKPSVTTLPTALPTALPVAEPVEIPVAKVAAVPPSFPPR